MDLNKVMLIGRITRQPELKTTTTGQNVVSFSIATNRTWKDKDGNKQERAEFHNLVAWGKLADICNQYLEKGKKIYVEGRLQTRDWEGQDGVKRYRTEVVMSEMIMLDRAGAATAGSGDDIVVEPLEDNGPTDEVNLEDIPF
jgi:single-strand DNA-binding protein